MTPSGSVFDVRRMSGTYEYIGSFAKNVYPGGLEQHVVRHVESGSYWAKNVHMDDDSSWESGDWYPVTRHERVIVEYVRS